MLPPLKWGKWFPPPYTRMLLFSILPNRSLASGSKTRWCFSPKQWLTAQCNEFLQFNYLLHEVAFNFVLNLLLRYLRTPALTRKGNVSSFFASPPFFPCSCDSLARDSLARDSVEYILALRTDYVSWIFQVHFLGDSSQNVNNFFFFESWLETETWVMTVQREKWSHSPLISYSSPSPLILLTWPDTRQ